MYIVDIAFNDKKQVYITAGDIKNKISGYDMILDDTPIFKIDYIQNGMELCMLNVTKEQCINVYYNVNDDLLLLFRKYCDNLVKNNTTIPMDLQSIIGDRFKIFSGYNNKIKKNIKVTTVLHNNASVCNIIVETE
jgi:hypothetical protein